MFSAVWLFVIIGLRNPSFQYIRSFESHSVCARRYLECKSYALMYLYQQKTEDSNWKWEQQIDKIMNLNLKWKQWENYQESVNPETKSWTIEAGIRFDRSKMFPLSINGTILLMILVKFWIFIQFFTVSAFSTPILQYGHLGVVSSSLLLSSSDSYGILFICSTFQRYQHSSQVCWCRHG